MCLKMDVPYVFVPHKIWLGNTISGAMTAGHHAVAVVLDKTRRSDMKFVVQFHLVKLEIFSLCYEVVQQKDSPMNELSSMTTETG